ncbi:hypothetical protein ACC692_37210, partial [Rhizobium ruizarguesonis]
TRKNNTTLPFKRFIILLNKTCSNWFQLCIIFSGVANEAGYIKITQENATGTELSDNKPILHLIPSEEILQKEVQEEDIDIELISAELERI